MSSLEVALEEFSVLFLCFCMVMFLLQVRIIIIIIIITIIHMEIPGSWMEKVSSYSRITEFIVVYHIV